MRTGKPKQNRIMKRVDTKRKENRNGKDIEKNVKKKGKYECWLDFTSSTTITSKFVTKMNLKSYLIMWNLSSCPSQSLIYAKQNSLHISLLKQMTFHTSMKSKVFNCNYSTFSLI